MQLPFHRAWMTLLAVVLTIVSASPAGFAQAQEATPVSSASGGSAIPAIGTPVILQDERGRTDARIVVNEILDPAPGYSSSKRGYRVAAVKVSVASRGSKAFDVGPLMIRMTDDTGSFVDMSWRSGSTTGTPELNLLESGKVQTGEVKSGWVFFELAPEAIPSKIFYINYDQAPYFTVLADVSPVVAGSRGPTIILDRSGNEVGTLAIDQIIKGLEDADDAIKPGRGATIVSLVITLTNTSESTWRLKADEAFWILDQYGSFYFRVYFDLSPDVFKTFPQLRSRVSPGSSVTGLVTFEMSVDSEIASILFIPEAEQFYVVGGTDPAITITGTDAAALIVPVVRDTSCDGIVEWTSATAATMTLAGEVTEEIASSIESQTPTSIRDAATKLRITATSQEQIAAPEKAKEAQTDLIALLRAGAVALDDAAARLEAGESPQVVADNLQAPSSPFMVAANKAILSTLTLLVECPNPDFM